MRIHIQWDIQLFFHLAFWAPPIKYRKSPDHVLVLELLTSDEKEVTDSTDSNETETEQNSISPYNKGGAAKNEMQKEFNHKSNNQGVIIFKLPLDRLMKDNIKNIRVKVINSDYDQSKPSKSVSVFSERKNV